MRKQPGKHILPVIFAFGLLLLSCGEKTKRETATNDQHDEHSEGIVLTPDIIKKVDMTIERPQKIALQRYFTAQGKVVVNPDYVAHINTLIPGKISKIYVQIGDYVTQNQPLFELESLEIANIISDFTRGKAELEVQKANYERIKKLRAEDIKAEKDLISARADFNRAVAALRASDRKLHSIGFNDEDVEKMFNQHEHGKSILVIKSPISGYVTERNIELGQLLESNRDAMKIIDDTKIWIEAQVYEKDYPFLKRGQKTIVFSQVLPGKKFAGVVSYINKEVDAESRTFKVFIQLRDGKSQLKPNMFASINFYFGQSDSILVVPDEAVQFDGNDYFVFVEDKPNTFKRKRVVPGAKVDGLLPIEQGLDGLERVVTGKAFFVKSEMEKKSFGEGHGH